MNVVHHSSVLVSRNQSQSPLAEAYRMFRTNLQFSRVDGKLKVILFTSSNPGEGKSVTIANTAVSLAQSGKKVILIDCDLRRPVQHLIFGRTAIGLTTAMFEHKDVTTLLQETDQANLLLLASGALPPNPAECLGSVRMAEILERLKAQADYVLIDSPPVLPVSDACILASKVDGVIMVLGARIVKQEMARRAVEALQQAKGDVLGVIVNRTTPEFELYDYNTGKTGANRTRRGELV